MGVLYPCYEVWQVTRNAYPGWLAFSRLLSSIPVCLGIMNKRMLGHPEQMVFFHLPAAFFLVLSCYELSADFRKRNREAIARYNQRTQIILSQRE